VFAGTELQSNSVPGEESYEIHSSDTNEIQIENVENVIENSANMDKFVTKDFLISGLYDEFQDTSRQCKFCWIFAGLFALYLFFYGKQLAKKKTRGQGWFAWPLAVGVIVYLAHGFVHQLSASSIFLEYYWMIIFDELIVSYIFYSHIVKKKTKKRVVTHRNTTRKLATS
jgi:hypothetical protein